ncbi:sugar-transfer associated ATP-grasp domain-containing protein [Aquimarina sp. 2201CG1-2-11]|uniref:sugar-transfer associated ATP-grasp domain-containing protein n=1 Tax=Aquimarina discodermiae TaxID=3231043 RepID=UPI0034628382
MKQKLTLLKKRVSVVVNDENEKKGIFQIIKESIIFWIVKKEFPFFYFGKFLYRKDVGNYKDYLSSKEVDKITLSKNLHLYQYASLLRNKLTFAIFMERNNMPVPLMVSYNFKHNFFLGAKVYNVATIDDLYKYFNDLFVQTSNTKVFVKAIAEMGGVGSYLITKDNLEQELDQYGAYILANDCIHQELIIQHDLINTIYEGSVNSIRFDTYRDKNGTTHILCAYMRFGRGGSVLDNSTSGGFWVGIDIEKGQLKGKSYQFMQHGGKRLDRHPDSKVIFDGYEIPYFKEACEVVRKCVTHIPDRIIGWDIAISKNGPVVIEGNDNNSLLGPDLVYQGLLKHPLAKEIMEEA